MTTNNKNYNIFTVTKHQDRYLVNCFRRGITKEMAHKLKAERMANPRRQTEYIIVADSRMNEFKAKVEQANIKLEMQWAKINAKKLQAWDELKEAYVKGYKVTDTLAYINKA